MIDFKYIDSLPDALTELYAQVETEILNDMAERINAMDFFNASVQWQEQKLQQMGLSHNLIVRKLSQLTGKTETELTKLINQAGAQVLASNAWLADAGYNLASVSASEKWKARLSAGLKKTSLLFTNLTQTTAYATDRAFGQALDRAYMQIESGAFSYTEAVRNAVKDLSAKGLRTVMYVNNGIIHTDNVDVAVRRAVLTGVNQTTAELQLTVNEELGLDLVEVSAHAGARPSHAEWQGRIYSLSGKSTKYPDFRESTGYGTGAGLCGWNCRHTFYPWAEGSSRVWSDQALAKLEDATVEYNGGKYTEYEASQYQRSLERAIRKYKREASALKSAGQPNQAELAKVSQYNAKLNDFCEQTGFKKQYDRTFVTDGTIKEIPKPKTPPKPKKPEFVPASTLEDAEKAFARISTDRQFGAIGVSYKGISLEVANEINRTLIGLYDEYAVDMFGGIQAPAGNTKLGQLVSGATAGYAPIRNSFLINRKAMSSMKVAEAHFKKETEILSDILTHPEKYDLTKASASLRNTIERSKVSGRATVPTNVEEALTHEFGHALERKVKKAETWEQIRANMDTYADKISGYAGQDPSEYIAESFVSYRKGEGLADPVLTAVFESLRR